MEIVKRKVLRDSNIELLRIVSMFYIVVLHIVGIGLTFYDISGEINFEKLLIESFAIIGVNCFILISGYFGISLNLLSVSKFILECLFYSIFIIWFVGLFIPEIITTKSIIISFFPFGHMTWWFITPYLCLCLFSPVLNRWIDKIDKKTFILTLTVLLYVNLYFGFLWGNDINKTGYTISQFILLYFIGRFIHIYRCKVVKYKALGIYVICCLALAFISFYVLKIVDDVDFLNRYIFSYNNPLVLIASISFFLFWISFKCKYRVINYLSAGVFSVYLIHMHPAIQPLFFQWVKEIHLILSSYNIIIMMFVWIMLILLFMLVCSLGEHLRRSVFNNVTLYIFDFMRKKQYLSHFLERFYIN